MNFAANSVITNPLRGFAAACALVALAAVSPRAFAQEDLPGRVGRVANLAGDRPGDYDDQNTDDEHDRHGDRHADANGSRPGNRSPLGDVVDRVRSPHEGGYIAGGRPKRDDDTYDRGDARGGSATLYLRDDRPQEAVHPARGDLLEIIEESLRRRMSQESEDRDQHEQGRENCQHAKVRQCRRPIAEVVAFELLCATPEDVGPTFHGNPLLAGTRRRRTVVSRSSHEDRHFSGQHILI